MAVTSINIDTWYLCFTDRTNGQLRTNALHITLFWWSKQNEKEIPTE
jgi:hypothetical protein